VLTLMIVLAVVVLLAVTAGAAATWYYRASRPNNRQAAARNEAMLAEARLDLLTRQTMQHMRDVVRHDLRRRHRGDVIDGDITE
jgi:Tfp pilus assembly protein PilE